MWTLIWCTTLLFSGHDGKEPTDRLIPPGWEGNPWGPAATRRGPGEIPPIAVTPLMQQWDAWGKPVLRDGDILFRRGDARVLFGRFPFSRFIANASGSLVLAHGDRGDRGRRARRLRHHQGRRAPAAVRRLGPRQRRPVRRQAAPARVQSHADGDPLLPRAFERAGPVRLRAGLDDRRSTAWR